MLVDVAVLAFLGIGDNATRHCSGNLPTEHVHPVGRGDEHVGTLVFFAGLRQPRLVEVAILVLDRLHLTIHRKPVRMHVEGAHEDGNHQPAVVEILRFLDFLNDHDLAVGRRHDDSLGVFERKIAHRTAEKVHDDGIECAENSHEKPKPEFRIEPPEQQSRGCNHDEAPNKRVGALAMQSYLLQFTDFISHKSHVECLF